MAAGNPAALKHTGRVRGSKNRKTIAMEELFHNSAIATKLAGGKWKSPLALLLEWANDQTLDHDYRLKAADILMPYCHRKQPVATETNFSTDSPAEIKVKFVQPKRTE